MHQYLLKKIFTGLSSICLLVSVACVNAVAQSAKPHPYLFYTTDRVSLLKKRVKTDTLLANSWAQMKHRCDNWIAQPKGGDMEQLALAYNMTGDTRYADRAKQQLMTVVNKNAWDGMDDRTPRWNAGLGTSHTNWTASVTFDAIYNSLTASERKDIAHKIVKLGIEPTLNDWLSKDKRIQSLNNMGHNWWSAIVFEAGTASLAVMNEIPEARQWANDVMEASKEWFAFTGSVLENKPTSFDPEGGFYESINYANYGISEYLFFRVAYTNAEKNIKMPYDPMLQKTMNWFINAGYPRSGKQSLMSLNFGDGSDLANGDRPAKLLIYLGMGKSADYWYLRQTAKRSFNEDLNTQTPMGLLYQPDLSSAPALPNLKPSAMYTNMGWGMLRSSWQPDATLLGIKCGFTWNHAHADAGSFVLYHNGENLLIDGGDVSYAQPEYSDYYVTSRAHNVVMFNGLAQEEQDEYHAVKTPGHVYNMLDGGFVKYMLADATGPTSRNFLRNYRNFLWIGNVILVIDDIKTYEAGKIDFLLHYQDSAVKKGPDLEITKNRAGILFRPLYPETLPLGYPHDFPEKMQFKVDYGLKDRDAKVKIPYYVISPPEKTDRTKLVNAIILLNDDNKPAATFTGSSGANGSAGRTNLPVIEKFEGTNYIGVRIKQNHLTTEVYINLLADGRMMHRNANMVINGWETDAYISAITFPENADRNDVAKLQSVFVSNGSYLRRNNKVILSSLSKVFMYAEKDEHGLNVQLNGQPLIKASLGFPKSGQLMLNDHMIAPAYDRDGMLLITTGGSN